MHARSQYSLLLAMALLLIGFRAKAASDQKGGERLASFARHPHGENEAGKTPNDGEVALILVVPVVFGASLFQGEGPFVELPAKLGGWIGLAPTAIIGFVGGLLISYPVTGALLGGMIGYRTFGGIVGVPFLFLKRACRDLVTGRVQSTRLGFRVEIAERSP